jgi:hypothetical protein
VADAVLDDVIDGDFVRDGVGERVREGELVRVTDSKMVGVTEADTPTVNDDVGVGDEEQSIAAESPSSSQQEQGVGKIDAKGQKYPTGHKRGLPSMQ